MIPGSSFKIIVLVTDGHETYASAVPGEYTGELIAQGEAIRFFPLSLMGRLIMVRTQMGEEVSAWIKQMLQPKQEKEEKEKI